MLVHETGIYPLSIYQKGYQRNFLTSFNSPSTCFIAPIRANLPTRLAKELSWPSSLWAITSIKALSTSPKTSTEKQNTCRKQCKNLDNETRSENIAKSTSWNATRTQSILCLHGGSGILPDSGFSCRRGSRGCTRVLKRTPMKTRKVSVLVKYLLWKNLNYVYIYI